MFSKNDNFSERPLIPPEGALTVRSFGAKGDGRCDDTVAIQKAINAAAKCQGEVWFAPGIYCTSTLKLKSGVVLSATPNWGLHHEASTILRLADERAQCLLDLNGAMAVRIRGLSLDGQNLGRDIVGVQMDGRNRPEVKEDTPFIEYACIRNFSGHGVNLMYCWEFVIRGSLIGFNGGNGLNFSHYDGFLFENMFSANKGYGISACYPNGSQSISNNRIEWNDRGGMRVDRGSNYQITGNYFDRSGGAGLHITGTQEIERSGFTITGNIFNRSGVLVKDEDPDCSHIRLDGTAGVVLANNILKAGLALDGSSTGRKTPAIGLLYGNLRQCLLRNNIISCGATKKLILDCGGSDEDTVVEGNIGKLCV